VKLESLKGTEFIYGNIGGRLLVAMHLGSLQNKTLVLGDPISSTQVAVKPSEAAESCGVSSENFGSYNTLCPMQNMGSGKLSKQARHLAKCRNILAQKIAARHHVPQLSLAELADLESRHAEEEDSNTESDNSSSQGTRIAEAH
jgi:hypothetical protein